MKPLEQFYPILGYSFKAPELLEEALTHPSLSREKKKIVVFNNYERLEFLGDGVLGLVIAELLFTTFPEEAEGALAKRQAALIRGKTVSGIAEALGVGQYLRMSEGEANCGGRENASNLENGLEAIIGAIYVDGGFEPAKAFILKHWSEMASSMKEPPKDPKTALQEWAQGRGLPIPEYQVMATEGPAHQPIFQVEVRVRGHEPLRAEGENKKKAEKEAAQKLLAQLEKNT